MIGPIARWAIKQALLQTAKAVDTKIAANKKAEREAEVRQEEEREATDPAYRAYKDAMREKARIAEEKAHIAQEVEDRKLARRELVRTLLWRGSQVMYAVCVFHRLFSPAYDYHFHLSSVENILASIWMLIVLLYAVSDLVVLMNDSFGKGLGCGVVMLIPLCWLGYIFLEAI